MPLAIEQNTSVNSLSVCWLLPAGVSREPDDRLGIAAVTSELLFRGCGDLDSRAQADALDTLGVTRSASVSVLHTRLSATFLPDQLERAMHLLIDMVRRPRFEPDAIEPARELALSELASLADDPHQRAVKLAKERHNPPPTNRSSLGDEPGLRGITRDDVAGTWDACARPGGSILTLAGNISDAQVDRLVALLNERLADWSGAVDEPACTENPDRGSYHHEHDDSAQTQIVMLYEAPAEPDPASPLERLRNAVLSGGMASRLFTQVREERGLCYAVNQSYAPGKRFGRCLAYVGTTPQRAQESLDVLRRVLEDIASPGHAVTRDEFDRAMIGIRSSIVFSGESTAARAGSLASDIDRLGSPRSLDEIAARYADITLDRLNSYLAERTLGDATIVTLGPDALTPPGT